MRKLCHPRAVPCPRALPPCPQCRMRTICMPCPRSHKCDTLVPSRAAPTNQSNLPPACRARVPCPRSRMREMGQSHAVPWRAHA
eukprot:9474196-Pyramimonas_sp.AAC.1